MEQAPGGSEHCLKRGHASCCHPACEKCLPWALQTRKPVLCMEGRHSSHPRSISDSLHPLCIHCGVDSGERQTQTGRKGLLALEERV